ncbi:hypothetical protein NUACC26_042920 [Scytonema sp. NUACC26]
MKIGVCLFSTLKFHTNFPQILSKDSLFFGEINLGIRDWRLAIEN